MKKITRTEVHDFERLTGKHIFDVMMLTINKAHLNKIHPKLYKEYAKSPFYKETLPFWEWGLWEFLIDKGDESSNYKEYYSVAASTINRYESDIVEFRSLLKEAYNNK